MYVVLANMLFRINFRSFDFLKVLLISYAGTNQRFSLLLFCRTSFLITCFGQYGSLLQVLFDYVVN